MVSILLIYEGGYHSGSQGHGPFYRGGVVLSRWSDGQGALCFRTPCSHAGPVLSSPYWRLEAVSMSFCLNGKLRDSPEGKVGNGKEQRRPGFWGWSFLSEPLRPPSRCQLPWETRASRRHPRFWEDSTWPQRTTFHIGWWDGKIPKQVRPSTRSRCSLRHNREWMTSLGHGSDMVSVLFKSRSTLIIILQNQKRVWHILDALQVSLVSSAGGKGDFSGAGCYCLPTDRHPSMTGICKETELFHIMLTQLLPRPVVPYPFHVLGIPAEAS